MRRKKQKWGLMLFMPFWLLIVAMFTGLIIIQASRYNSYQRELARVTEELTREKKVTAELEDEIVYYDSDAYIEQIAREQLGFIKPDEIVFINIAD